MGLVTLAEFQEDVQRALGNRGLSNPELNRYINYAYQELAGAIKFSDLEEIDTSIATVAATQSYNEPTKTQYIQLVKDTTSSLLLEWTPKFEFFRLGGANAAPTRWTRFGGKIYLHPTPDAVYNLTVIYKKEPTVLANDADTTVLPETWDSAVFMLATHYGLLKLGEDNRAIVWYQRAINYVRSRVTDEEALETEGGLGKSLAGLMTGAQQDPASFEEA